MPLWPPLALKLPFETLYMFKVIQLCWITLMSETVWDKAKKRNWVWILEGLQYPDQ